MALTDVPIRKAKHGAKAMKLADGGDMFPLVTPTGGKLWRLKYLIDGRARKLAVGTYPVIGLAEARRVRTSYHRDADWHERVAMAQWWSDHFDQLGKGAQLVSIKAEKR